MLMEMFNKDREVRRRREQREFAYPRREFQEDLVQAGPSGYQPPRNPSIGYKLRFSLVYSIITVEKLVSSECYYSV